MKAIAFANNDMAIVAWTFGGKVDNCLGFAVYRIDVRAGTETCLPAMATFPKQSAKPGRTTADDPVQKFFWKDVYAQRGGTFKYKIVPMGGTPGGTLHPLPFGPLVSNAVQLSPNYGMMSAYFNRGILATQSTAHQLHGGKNSQGMKNVLLTRIENQNDQLRKDLAGEMIEAMTALPDEAHANGEDCYCALYEFEDQELIAHLAALKGNAHIILSNMPGTIGNSKNKTNDTYAAERDQIKQAGADVIDRFMPSSHIGHNKYTILSGNDGPKAVQFGSTNWTSRALCAQTNNTVIARSPKLATEYKKYWDRLKADTGEPHGKGGVTAQQGPALRTPDANGGKPTPVQIEDGSCSIDIWFSPDTPSARGKNKANEACPPDLTEVFSIIQGAQQAILFLAFQPGAPSIVDEIAKAEKAKPSLFIRGALTDAGAANRFYVGIKGAAPEAGQKRPKGSPPLPQDYRVISARGVKDNIGLWENELNSAGHAVIHDKILVVDPFTDNCVVVTGSHNLGYTASYNNDENMAIIRGHRAIAEAYAAHVLDIYDHYAWRFWLEQKNYDAAWTFLTPNDGWQDSYFDAQNKVKSAELNFWLSASPSTDALPTPVDPATVTRSSPAIQKIVGGISPALGRRKRAPARPPASRATKKSRSKKVAASSKRRTVKVSPRRVAKKKSKKAARHR
jgi:phosphatidylserine/phosphatidylglycerophosphate/cardiolipin synthase-like enzyme